MSVCLCVSNLNNNQADAAANASILERTKTWPSLCGADAVVTSKLKCLRDAKLKCLPALVSAVTCLGSVTSGLEISPHLKSLTSDVSGPQP